ncbi:DUF2637 domain-containing protein [Knoellia sp. LjRoot47]|uniref:DUF2637 domain-containing protein n=1 Tax=Knoellia sp. LjRoot47 TaxID=3342330 RepID=UPI003ECE053C
MRALIGVFAVLVIASAVLSSTGLHALGVRAGVDPVLAWLVPVACDGLIAAGLLAGLYGTLSRTGTGYAWALVTVGTAMSVAGNVAAAPEGITPRLVHAGAPVVLALSLEAVLGPIRARAGLPARRTRKSTPAPSSTPAAPVAASPQPVASTTTQTRKSAESRPARAGSKAAAVRALLAQDPTIPVPELVDRTGIDRSEARRIRTKMQMEVTV